MSISGAVGDLFSAAGSFQEANAYGKAKDVALDNEAITLRSGQIQQQQENQAIITATGGEQAAVAGAGFTAGGSAGDLMRMSLQKGALNKQLLANQNEITAQGFEQQADAYKGQQQAAQTQGEGQAAGGALQAIGWVICTELVKQGRMPKKYWMPGASVFASYPDAVREGYYVWAVPSVRHLRANPISLYSIFLSAIFNWRAENIAAHAGVRGARILLRGALVTAVLWPLCYAIGAVRLALKFDTNWKGLYSGKH